MESKAKTTEVKKPNNKVPIDKSIAAEKKTAFLFVLPAIAIIGIISIYPILRTVYLSLFSMQMQFQDKTKFIGLDNYKFLLHDQRFWSSIKTTLYFMVISVALELILGLILALFINMPLKMRGLIRASVLIPWAVPTVVSALMWKFIYDDQLGILNDILLKLHIISKYKVFLGSAASSMWSMIFADVWKTTPFMALLLLAGLQVIPKELYESGQVDGAGKIRQFMYITLPLLKPTILVALLFRTLDAFRVFDLPWVLTGGTTETISIYAYQSLFTNLDFGMGSALAFSVFVCVMLISLFYIKVLGVKR
jgi:multiple sugar transport system permease protein